MNRKIAFIGGDHRQTVALSLLSEKYETAIFGFDSYDSDIGSAVRCKQGGTVEYAMYLTPDFNQG